MAPIWKNLGLFTARDEITPLSLKSLKSAHISYMEENGVITLRIRKNETEQSCDPWAFSLNKSENISDRSTCADSDKSDCETDVSEHDDKDPGFSLPPKELDSLLQSQRSKASFALKRASFEVSNKVSKNEKKRSRDIIEEESAAKVCRSLTVKCGSEARQETDPPPLMFPVVHIAAKEVDCLFKIQHPVAAENAPLAPEPFQTIEGMKTTESMMNEKLRAIGENIEKNIRPKFKLEPDESNSDEATDEFSDPPKCSNDLGNEAQSDTSPDSQKSTKRTLLRRLRKKVMDAFQRSCTHVRKVKNRLSKTELLAYNLRDWIGRRSSNCSGLSRNGSRKRQREEKGISAHYLFANPLTLGASRLARLNIENELRLLHRAVRDETGFQLSVRNLTNAHLRDSCLRCPSVLIIAGHVVENCMELVVEDDIGRGVFFPKREFEQLPLGGVDLVVLMACDSSEVLEFIQGPSVISCTGKVVDAAAQLFTRSLCVALSQMKKQNPTSSSLDLQLEAFEYAKSAVRTAAQPWAFNSTQFQFSPGYESTKMTRPLEPSWAPCDKYFGRGSVEDFVGRQELFSRVCHMFKRGRRVVGITGPRGCGKSAFGKMFSKYFRLPGRLFDRHLRLHVTESVEEVQAIVSMEDVTNVVLFTGDDEIEDMQFDEKVISFPLPPLQDRDAVELFMLRVHRPLTAADLIKDHHENLGVLTRDKITALLHVHPVIQNCKGLPLAILSMASKVTRDLPSMFDLMD